MSKSIDKILNSPNFHDLKIIHSKNPGKVLPIFLDIASLGQNIQSKYSKYIAFLTILICLILAYTSDKSILVSFGANYLFSLFILFSISQIEIAFIGYKTEMLYNNVIDRLSPEDKKKLSLNILKKELDIKFKEEIRGNLLEKLKERQLQSEKEQSQKIEPTYK